MFLYTTFVAEIQLLMRIKTEKHLREGLVFVRNGLCHRQSIEQEFPRIDSKFCRLAVDSTNRILLYLC